MSVPEEIDRLLAEKDRSDLDQLGRAQTGGRMKAKLLSALESLGNHDCWCEVAIGNPMFGGRHSRKCLEIAALVKRGRAEILNKNGPSPQAGDTSESRP